MSRKLVSGSPQMLKQLMRLRKKDTSAVTTAVKALPTIRPTAMSSTLPLEINSLNSAMIFFMLHPPLVPVCFET